MNRTIVESGMQFVSENVFYIEKSPQYAELGDSVKTVEFARAKGNKLLFVEAKSSFPNPHNLAYNKAKGNKTGEEIFYEEIDDIYDKFAHSLSLYSAVGIGATKDGFPTGYEPAHKVSLVFILVIRGFEMSWCDEIESALKQRIRASTSIAKIWRPKVLVMNDEVAAIQNVTVSPPAARA